jgi:hypothetical protein
MKNAMLALFLVSVLTMPAIAGSLNVGDKPMVVAEGVEVGVDGVGVGVRHHHRHHVAPVVVDPEHRHDHDRDSDRR